METLAARHLTVTFPECKKPVLSDVSFELESGTFAVICGIAKGVTEWQFYPVCAPALRNLPYFAVLAAYALLALLPLICEGKEALTWKRLQSEI